MEKKQQLYGYFKQQNGEIAHEKTWIALRNRHLKKETEALL